MKAEFAKLLKLYEELEEAGENATLTLSSKGGNSTIKLLLESSPSPPLTSSPSSLPPAPQRRRRHRGAAARARRKQRAADYQASLPDAAATTSSPASGEDTATPGPPPQRPLHLLESPSPSTARRRVMSLGRPAEMTSFASLNLDGHSSSPPLPLPQPTPPPLPLAQDILDSLKRFDSVGEVCCAECGERLYSIFYSSKKPTDDDECDLVHLHDQFPGEKVLWNGICKETGNPRLFCCGGPPPSKLPLLP